MYSKGILGIAGVALIGTLATNVAHATFTLNDDGELQGGLTVPRETLVEAGSMMKDDITYYRVKQSDAANELDLRMPTGVARAAGEELRLIVTLDGALFAQNVSVTTNAATILRTYDNAGTELSRSHATNNITVTRLEGGMKGDSSVTLGVETAGNVVITADSEFLFEPRELLVDPNRPVSITLQPTYNFAGAAVGASTTFPGVITVADGVNVTSELPAENPVASVTDDFTKFKGPDGGDPVLTAHLGQFEVKVATTTAFHLAVTASGVVGAAILPGEIEKIVASTEVTLGGDTSFLGEGGDIYLATHADCRAAAKMSFLQTGEDMTRSVDEVNLDWGTVSGARHLCISVPEEDGMPIPATDAYTLTLAHTMAVTDAEFERANDVLTMGRITRDGTSMYVPWLTTDDRYNQRIVLWNRSSRAAGYALTFTTEDGVTATAGADAAGTLAANSRTVLSMRNDDVVTLAGGNRTSATIMVVAPSGLVEASTVTLNRQDGSTDTVVYSSQ